MPDADSKREKSDFLEMLLTVWRTFCVLLVAGLVFSLVQGVLEEPENNLLDAATKLLDSRKSSDVTISIGEWLGPDVDGLCVYSASMGNEQEYLALSPPTFSNAIRTLASENIHSFEADRTYIFVIRHGQPAERNELLVGSSWEAGPEPDNEDFDRCYAADEKIEIGGIGYQFGFPKSRHQPGHQVVKPQSTPMR